MCFVTRKTLMACCLSILLPSFAKAENNGNCGSGLVQICAEEARPTEISPVRKSIRVEKADPAYAVGDEFPLAQYNVLMNPAQYGLPPVDGHWRYYKASREVYRVDPVTEKVLEHVDASRLSRQP